MFFGVNTDKKKITIIHILTLSLYLVRGINLVESYNGGTPASCLLIDNIPHR